LLILGVVATTLYACSETKRRYRVTYAFETPRGEVKGSHVLETWRALGGGVVGRYSFGMRGEAAAIELAPGKLVFAILASGPRGDDVDAPRYIASATYAEEVAKACGGPARGCSIYDVNTAGFPPKPVPPERQFTLVTFTDLNDPASAKVLKPDDGSIFTSDFVRAFGPGFRLASVTLEMVPVGVWPFNLVGLSGTPVTRGIEGKIGTDGLASGSRRTTHMAVAQVR
jgi:hypothetical protein